MSVSYLNFAHSPLFKNFISFVFSYLISFSLFAQNEKIDDLKSNLLELSNDTLIIDTYNELGYEYYPFNTDSTFYYSEKALRLAKQLNYQKGISTAFNNLATGHSIMGDNKKAIEIYNQALEISRDINNHEIIANSLNNLAISYCLIGMHNKALSNYIEAIDYAKSANAETLLCFIYRNMSQLYTDLGETENSNMYRQKEIEVARQSDHHMLRHLIDFRLGQKYYAEGKLNEALSAHQKALENCSDLYCKFEVAREIIIILLEQERFEEAENQILYYLKKNKEANNIEALMMSEVSYANVLFKQKKYKQCLKQIDKSILDHNLSGAATNLSMQLYQLKSETLIKLKDYEAAVKSMQTQMSIQDTLLEMDKISTIVELDTKYQVNEKEKENSFLKIEQEKSNIIIWQKNRETWMYIAFIVLLSVVSLLAVKGFQDKQRFNHVLQEQVLLQTQELQKSNQRLKASNIELERFAYITSHDLKEPLRNISGFSFLLERKINQINNAPKEIHEYLLFIKRNTLQMNQLIEDILEYSRLENADTELQDADISKVLADVVSNLNTTITEKNVSIIFPEFLPKINSYPSQLFIIFQNLISNGIKFNENINPQILINYKDQNTFHQFSITDNGIGLPKEYQDKVFEMFKRLHNREAYIGSGLGLAICKKILGRLGGNIWIEEIETEGTKFCFNIPKNPKNY